MSNLPPIHPKFLQRHDQVNDMKKAAETKGVKVVPFEKMSAFGQKLFKDCGSFQIEIDPGEYEYTYASEQVKAWQQQYREAKSEALKEKLKKRINDNTGMPFTPESHYLGLRFLQETDEKIKTRIRDQMYGKDHVIDLPENLEEAIKALLKT